MKSIDPIISHTSYNYTFHSLGAIGTIFMLYCVALSIDKSNIIYVHFGSLASIIIVSNLYCRNYEARLSTKPEIFSNKIDVPLSEANGSSTNK